MKNNLIRLSILLLLSTLFYTKFFAQHNTSNFDLERGIFIDPSETVEPTRVKKEENNPAINLDPSEVNCNCKTDFFTINNIGDIRKWSVLNNVVTGGGLVLTGGNSAGLAFCGPGNSRTFFCASIPGAIRYYDTTATTWNNIVAPFSVIVNNGGYKNHQYYMEGTDKLHYYNGYTFTQIPVPGNYNMAAADIAVDKLGQAWVFSGNGPNATHLFVFDSTGLKTTYNYVANTNGAYGSFFLNDTLYLARGIQSQIVPILINGTTAQEGTPILFPNNNYYDAASCYCLDPAPPPCQDLTATTYLLPNNINGLSQVEFAVKVTETNNISTDGSVIVVRIPSDSRLIFVWDIGLTTTASIPVQNADWNYLGNNGVVHTWTYNAPGLVIPGGTSSAFGFQAFYDPQLTSGNTSLTATIIPYSGGECNVLNNIDVETMVYFD